jgi:hypothetical protein
MENALVRKLKIKEGQQVVLLNPPAGFTKEIGPLPGGVKIADKLKVAPLIILFVSNKAEVEKWVAKVVENLEGNGLLWLCFPKGTSGIQTDLTRDKGWESLAKFNLKLITLIAINEQWSAFAVRRSSEDVKFGVREKSEANKDITKFIDTVNKKVTLPPFLGKILKADNKAYKMYESLAYTNRKEYVVWILDAKQEETRQKRIKLMLEKLRAGLKNPSDKG